MTIDNLSFNILVDSLKAVRNNPASPGTIYSFSYGLDVVRLTYTNEDFLYETPTEGDNQQVKEAFLALTSYKPINFLDTLSQGDEDGHPYAKYINSSHDLWPVCQQLKLIKGLRTEKINNREFWRSSNYGVLKALVYKSEEEDEEIKLALIKDNVLVNEKNIEHPYPEDLNQYLHIQLKSFIQELDKKAGIRSS